MVSFKQFVLATSLLLSAVAADPIPVASRTLSVALTERRAVNDFAIESRDLNNEESIAAPPPNKSTAPTKNTPPPPPPNKPATPPKNAPPPPPKNAPPTKKCRPTKRDSLASKILLEGREPDNIKENEYVTTATIAGNSGHATVTNLSGCTAVFFYMGTTLRRVVHILCGNEESDARTAARDAGGSDSVTIAASSTTYRDNAIRGIQAGRPGITINTNNNRLYNVESLAPTAAITFRGATGSTVITQGQGTRTCRQPQ
jgi:outer membrane biosynthesis protein TonB